MHVFNFINNRLEEMGFYREDNQGLFSLGITCYVNERRNVLLKNFIQEPTIQEIKKESLEIREILLSQNKNIWNTYYLICLENENKDVNERDDNTYLLERDTTAIRKYIIQNVKIDINRIPFLDDSTFVMESDKNSFNDTLTEKSELIKKASSLIQDNEGDIQRLVNEKIENIALKLLEDVK